MIIAGYSRPHIGLHLRAALLIAQRHLFNANIMGAWDARCAGIDPVRKLRSFAHGAGRESQPIEI